MSATNTNMLVIVAKYPEPGQVKTRLGAVIGADRAAALYSAFLRDLAARFETHDAPDAPWTLRWAVAPGGRPPEALRAITGPRAHVFSQRGEDFDDRLYHICEDARALGARRLAIISSDAPQIEADLVTRAFAAVGERPHPAKPQWGPLGHLHTPVGVPTRAGVPTGARAPTGARGGWGVRSLPPTTYDIALSPAEDGGYSLIALRLSEAPVAPPDLFRGITMSTSTVLAETRARAETLGLSVALLESTFDVDEAADLGRLWVTLRAAPSLAPRSYAALAALIASPLAHGVSGNAGAVGNAGNAGNAGNEETHGDIASHW